VKRYSLLRSRRMKSSRDFARVYEKRLRASDGCLLVYAAENNLGRTRFGVSVSRKVGKSVVRSNVKRLLREAFRLSQHELPSGLDLILIPQRRTDGAAPLVEYQRSLVELTKRLSRRMTPRQA
jgi:ribonuclease P protein component